MSGELLRPVRWDEAKKPHREALLDCLLDLRWHHNRELMRIGGNRYGGRLQELRDEGYTIESRPLADRTAGKEYRLVSSTPGAARQARVKVYLEADDARQLLGGNVTLFAREAVRRALVARKKRGQ